MRPEPAGDWGGSFFPHKRIHKATWRSPVHRTENQINNICISRKFRRSWRDVRVLRGADVSSDHHLVMTVVRLWLKKYTYANSNTQTRYDMGLLRNKDTQTAFQISLSNRFQLLQGLIDDTVRQTLRHSGRRAKNPWRDAHAEVLGKKKAQHKEWISTDTKEREEICGEHEPDKSS